MSLRTIFLAKLIGLTLIGFSRAMLTQKDAAVATATAMIHQPAFMLIFGMIALVAGLAIVLSHNLWSGGVLPVVVTIFGWVILIRGLLLLFLPEATIAAVFDMVHFGDYFGVYVGGILLLGLGLAVSGFRAVALDEAARPQG